MKKKHKTLIIIAIVSAGLLVFAAMFAFFVYLFGYGGYWRIRSAPKRHQFERLLKDKYNEEFVCLSTSSSGGKFTGLASMDHAKCAPVRDKTLLFRASKYPDYDELLRDTYAENMAEHQLADMMHPEISGMWDSFAMYCSLYNAHAFYSNEDVINKIREGEPEVRFFLDEVLKYQISNDYGDTIVVEFTVCFDDSTRNLTYEEEWEGFHKAAENFCASLSDYNVKIYYELYFSPSDRYERCAGIVNGHYSGSTGSWGSLENAVNREIDETKKGTVNYYGDWIYNRRIDIDTTHKAENNTRVKYPLWFNTAEDYAEFRAEMKTENNGG